MLVHLPTLAARAVRHKKPLVLVRVNDAAMASAAIAEFDEAGVDFALTYRCGGDMAADLAVLHGIIAAVRSATSDGAVLAEADAPYAAHVASLGIARMAETEQATFSDEILIQVARKAPTRERVESSRDAFSCLALPPGTAGEVVKDLAPLLPVIVRVDGRHTSLTRASINAGAAGVWVEDELQHAYTAGLRTALRDRERWDPSQYVPAALRAYRTALKTRIHSIHHQ